MSEDKKRLLGAVLLEKHVIEECDAEKALAANDEKSRQLGRILVDKKIVSEHDLEEALKEQRGSSLRLGDILVARGVASQKDITKAFSLQLQEGIEGKDAAKPFLLKRLKTARISIRVRLAVFITLLIVFIMCTASLYFYKSQKEEFINQSTRFGMSLAKNLSYNCSVPLLENDDASLNILIEEISKIHDIDYVMVLDKKGIVKAHSDMSKIDRPYVPIPRFTILMKNDLMEIVKFREGKKEVLNFSTPVKFSQVLLGYIHVGISMDSLREKIEESGLFLLLMTSVLIAVGIGVSFFISTQFSRPILNLLDGTTAIKSGNFSFRTERQQNDELGDLTLAFNNMAEGLRKKEVIQDAFGKYVNPEIVDMILSNPDGQWFQGRAIPVTVMFTDIRGFTSFTEKTPPEQVVALLNEHFTMATEIILRHGGHIDKFIGDAIFVVFGALMEYDDHAERAVRAAVSLQSTLQKKEKRDGGGQNIRIGIGINTGEVIAGNIGSHKRMEYTVIGDAVNLASRLTGIAGADEIIISNATYVAVAAKMKAEKLAPVSVKGKSEPVEIYRIIGMG
ncbi:MAG: adenylate/guanylate cyclase domain-containing protein [Desulfuromonadales bacterium]